MRVVPALLVLLVVAGSVPTGAVAPVDASFEERTVAPDSTAHLLVNGSADTTVEITAGIEPATLAAMVEGSERTDDGVRVRVGEDGVVPIQFPERFACRPGTYSFEVRAVGTNRTGVADIRVAATAEARTVFRDSVPSVAPNGTARLPLGIGCAKQATVTVEGEGFAANVTLNRTTERPLTETTLRYDPDATERFVAGPNATVTNVSIEGNDDGFAPGETYDLGLSADGETTDVATLRVNEPTTSPTVSPTPVTATEQSDTDGTPTDATATTTTTSNPGTATDPVTQPGFGPVVAVVALLAAAMLARNR